MRILLRILVPGTLLLILLSPLYLHAQTSEEEMMKLASQHFADGKYYFASTWLERLLKQNPATGHRREALLLLVKSCFLTERDEKSARYRDVLLQEYPQEGIPLDADLRRLAQMRSPAKIDVQRTPFPQELPVTDKSHDIPTSDKVSEAVKPATDSREIGKVLLKTHTETASSLSEKDRESSALVPVASLSTPGSSEPILVVAPLALPVEVTQVAQQTAETHFEPAPLAPGSSELTTVASPITPLVEARQVAPPAKESKDYYLLIAGESVNRKKLDPVVKKLVVADTKPIVAEVTREVEVFRLIVACLADRKSAEQRLAQTALRSMKAFLIRDGDSYCVVAGSLMSEESAGKEQQRLAKKGLEGLQIVQTRVPLKVWRVTAGRYADAREAEKSARALAKRGIEVIVGKSSN